MNRLLTLIMIGFAGLLVSCGSSVSSNTQPHTNDVYSVVVTPVLFTLNSGDWASITATVDVSYENGAAKPVAPQPTIKFYSSDSRVSVSPAGLVCAGEWDVLYQTCTPTSTLPAGYVTISVYNASNNVSGSTLLSVHPRATSISLNAPTGSGAGQYPTTTNCVSQNNQVKYTATAVDSSGTINNCSAGTSAGCVNDNDYTWTTDNASIATVSTYGFVVAHNPGVTNVFANLNGTISAPLAFATCPPNSIILSTSAYTNGTPTPPYTTGDLDNANSSSLGVGSQAYVTATLVDTNGNPLITSPLTYTTSNPLTGSFSTDLALTSRLVANTAGEFTMEASCSPVNCNPAVQDFVSPAGAGTSLGTGFGFPIYSNVIGATVHGQTGSTVLVTGTRFADSPTAPTPDCPSNQVCPHELLAYDSESLALTHTIALPNLPNSLVVAPNGAMAYLGSSSGLMVVSLSSYQASLMTYPVEGGLSTDVVTGTVLGVSPDSRYVVLSDVTNGLVFFIDTTVAKVAMRYTIPNITSVTFAADDSSFWVGGASGVYTYQGDTFIPISSQTPGDVGLSTGVKALAWMPDGQSYFASGDQLYNYSTCQSQNPVVAPLAGSTSGPINLDTTAIGGVPEVAGLAGTLWLDYSTSTTAQVGNQTANTTPASFVPSGSGNVCKSTPLPGQTAVSLTKNPPTASTVQCTAQQVTFSPTLEQEFITGVNPACTTSESEIHGYDLLNKSEVILTTAAPGVPLSGGVLNDGRKLYFGSWAGSTAQTATLHRIDLSTSTGTAGTLTEDLSTPVDIVPSFVAVVPK